MCNRFNCGVLDPSFFHDPSGCTAVAALLTSDGKIVCVSDRAHFPVIALTHDPHMNRLTQETRAPSSASRVR